MYNHFYDIQYSVIYNMGPYDIPFKAHSLLVVEFKCTRKIIGPK